jgi:pyruvate dehydrogenase E2 component (dihydrolipoamide acetyltransferase)
MASILRMPAPAAGVQQALLLEWEVEEKASFSAADVLAVIETDKAVIEIEAETDGTLHHRLVPAGTQVDVGTPIAVIGSDSDSADDIAALLAQAGGGQRPAALPAEAAPPAEAPSPADASSPTEAGPPSPDASPAAGGPDAAAANGDAGSPVAVDGAPARIFASPIARRMAKEAGLTLDELTGTGPGGRIVRRDVERAAASAARPAAAEPPAGAPAPATPAAASGAPGPLPSTRKGEADFTELPHTKIRTAIASRLSESKRTVPHFYLRGTARVDRLLELRAELNAGGGPKVSVNDLVVRAVARAHRAVPAMNVTFTETAVRQYRSVDVAVAIATDDGLVTPVVRDADRLSVTDIAAVTTDFAERARRGRIRQSELEGGSIAVSNLGMFGVEEFAAIINPPQSAILAVGAARREPVVDDAGELVAATVVHLVVSVDHRPLDGVVAARWMAALTDLLEHPVRILA